MAERLIDEHYQVIRQVESGSVAVTFLVLDRLSGQRLVLKSLRPLREEAPAAKASLDRHKQRFIREVQAMIRLNHPSIVPIYDCNVNADNPYYVMEFCGGGSLEKMIENGPMRQQAVLDILWPICSALQYAHNTGIVHRDIKPANILFATNGHPKLADFGMCRIADWHTFTCGEDSMLGTLYYLPPEQAQDPQSVDARGDIFALGRTVRHMLVGSPVGTSMPSSSGGSRGSRRHLKPWDYVIGRMTQLERDRRPESMRAVGRLLVPLSRGRALGDYARTHKRAFFRRTTQNPRALTSIATDDLTRIVADSLLFKFREPLLLDYQWLTSLISRLALDRQAAPLLSFLIQGVAARPSRKQVIRPSMSRWLLDAQRQALSITGPDGAKQVRRLAAFRWRR
ncbi:MAG: serine/threonine-protein kinase [Candidatus Eisenbacteria bacterium]|nr:serine/threonine-protein kinase [Candidatus Eisenbacteria bacterium]